MNKINILYTVDENYKKPLFISIYSLLDNNKDFDNINIYIIEDKLLSETKNKIEKIVSQFSNGNIRFYNANSLYCKMQQYYIPLWRNTKISNVRLFFPSIIPDTINDLLYLDSDTIITSSLLSLLKYQSKAVEAVYDCAPKSYYSKLLNSPNHYYNSGVLWIHQDEWSNQNCDELIRNIMKQNLKFTYPDQDILNIALQDNIGLLPPEFNLFSNIAYINPKFFNYYYKTHELNSYSKEELQTAKENPIIYHGIEFSHAKLWEKNTPHPFSNIFDLYLKKLPFKESEEVSQYILSKNSLLWNLLTDAKVYTPDSIKTKLKQVIKRDET